MNLKVGRYETLKAIASGGMATVYLGRAVGLAGFERLVAIKVMHPHLADDPEFGAMFLDEGRLAARIHHPNVVATIDVQQSDSGLVLVMQYVEGPSLHAILRKLAQVEGRRIPIGVVVRIIIDVLTGLDAAHELLGPDGELLHLVHRDVSPANILVGTDGVSRITDFGIARAAWRLSTTRDGQVKGKVAYMPPEQICGDPVDRRCDVYATGVVLWEALVGRRPFTATNDGALVHEVVSGVTQTPRQLVTEVPPAIDAVCMRALAVAPEQRYATASDFAEALEVAAIDSAIPIATSRSTAVFVKQLALHTPTTELITGLSKRFRSAPPSGGSDAHPRQATSLAEADGPEASPTQITKTAATITTTPAVKSGRPPIGLLVGAISVLALAGLGAVYVVASTPRDAAEPLPASSRQTARPAQGSPEAPATTSATDDSDNDNDNDNDTRASASAQPSSSTLTSAASATASDNATDTASRSTTRPRRKPASSVYRPPVPAPPHSSAPDSHKSQPPPPPSPSSSHTLPREL